MLELIELLRDFSVYNLRTSNYTSSQSWR